MLFYYVTFSHRMSSVFRSFSIKQGLRNNNFLSVAYINALICIHFFLSWPGPYWKIHCFLVDVLRWFLRCCSEFLMTSWLSCWWVLWKILVCCEELLPVFYNLVLNALLLKALYMSFLTLSEQIIYNQRKLGWCTDNSSIESFRLVSLPVQI